MCVCVLCTMIAAAVLCCAVLVVVALEAVPCHSPPFGLAPMVLLPAIKSKRKTYIMADRQQVQYTRRTPFPWSSHRPHALLPHPQPSSKPCRLCLLACLQLALISLASALVVEHQNNVLLVDLLGLQFATSSRSVPVGQQHHGKTDVRLLMTA